MTWPAALHHGVARELRRHGVEAWLMRLDRLDIRRIEASADGSSLQQGESASLSLALWWGERRLTVSFPIMPDRLEEVPGRVAAAIKSWAAATTVDRPAWPAPARRDAVGSRWQGDWDSLVERWRPRLIGSISGGRTGAQQLTLSLERRESSLRDHAGRTRRATRLVTRITISCRAGAQGRGGWTMTVPLDTPAPSDLAPQIRWAMHHARLRACRTPPVAGAGPVLLQPTALAQILAVAEASGDGDDIDAQPQPGVAPGPDLVRIPPGTLASRRAGHRGLIIWHFDELRPAGSPVRLAAMASGRLVTSAGGRDVSGLRLRIPWRAVQRALLDPGRRGRSPLAISFGEADYDVPTLALGGSSWAPR